MPTPPPRMRPSAGALPSALAGAIVLPTCLAAALAVSGAAAATDPPPVKPGDELIRYRGQISSGSGQYVNFRGVVRITLILHAVGRSDEPNPPDPDAFTMTLSGPRCAGQHIRRPRRCVRLRGTVTGAHEHRHLPSGPSDPKIARTADVSGKGRVTPLGRVTPSGTTRTVIIEPGITGKGQDLITLRLRNGDGSVTIRAKAPVRRGYFVRCRTEVAARPG